MGRGLRLNVLVPEVTLSMLTLSCLPVGAPGGLGARRAGLGLEPEAVALSLWTFWVLSTDSWLSLRQNH